MGNSTKHFFSEAVMTRYMRVESKKEKVKALTSRICTLKARIGRLRDRESTEENEALIEKSQLELDDVIMARRKVHSA